LQEGSVAGDSKRIRRVRDSSLSPVQLLEKLKRDERPAELIVFPTLVIFEVSPESD
jgi:hypothetical protein